MKNENNSNDIKKLTAYVGFAKKSGRITIGCNLTTDSIRSGGRRSPLVAVCASDASKNTKSRIENCCKYYEVPLVMVSVDSLTLGKMAGKDTDVAVVGISDGQLASAILKYFNQE